MHFFTLCGLRRSAIFPISLGSPWRREGGGRSLLGRCLRTLIPATFTCKLLCYKPQHAPCFPLPKKPPRSAAASQWGKGAHSFYSLPEARWTECVMPHTGHHRHRSRGHPGKKKNNNARHTLLPPPSSVPAWLTMPCKEPRGCTHTHTQISHKATQQACDPAF